MSNVRDVLDRLNRLLTAKAEARAVMIEADYQMGRLKDQVFVHWCSQNRAKEEGGGMYPQGIAKAKVSNEKRVISAEEDYRKACHAYQLARRDVIRAKYELKWYLLTKEKEGI